MKKFNVYVTVVYDDYPRTWKVLGQNKIKAFDTMQEAIEYAEKHGRNLAETSEYHEIFCPDAEEYDEKYGETIRRYRHNRRNLEVMIETLPSRF